MTASDGGPQTTDGGSYSYREAQEVGKFLPNTLLGTLQSQSHQTIRSNSLIFTTTETHCIEHAGRARVMFGRGGVSFYVF